MLQKMTFPCSLRYNHETFTAISALKILCFYYPEALFYTDKTPLQNKDVNLRYKVNFICLFYCKIMKAFIAHKF